MPNSSHARIERNRCTPSCRVTVFTVSVRALCSVLCSAEAYNSTKAAKVRELAAQLKKQGILDGVGMQMHVSVDSYPDPQVRSHSMSCLKLFICECERTNVCPTYMTFVAVRW